MKQSVQRINTRTDRVRRKSVAQILRAAYERFSRDKETLIAMNAVLRPSAKP